MSYLGAIFPRFARIQRLPFSRDQIMLLVAAINEIFLAIDIYLAHSISGTIQPYEWIPILFGAIAGVVLLLAGLIALRQRPLATILANLVFILSIIIGLMGIYFHLNRASLVNADPTLRGQAVGLLIWAPPFLGPFVFSLVGVLGISAAWIEDPVNSGRLRLLGNTHIQLPYSKTRAYFFIVSITILVTVISSTLDHARFNLSNAWTWLPAIAGIFGTVVAITLGLIDRPTRSDLTVYAVAMVMLIVVGIIGFMLHAGTNLVAQGTIVVERFIRGSPLLAPLLFANVGLLGLIVLLNPQE